jgi:hypothetical protein
MTPEEQRRLEALQELPGLEEEDLSSMFEDVNMQDILNGDEPLNISHAGGEFEALVRELNKDLRKT